MDASFWSIHQQISAIDVVLGNGNKRSAEPTRTGRFHDLEHPDVGEGMALLNIFRAM